jgi:hypothetical protein
VNVKSINIFSIILPNDTMLRHNFTLVWHKLFVIFHLVVRDRNQNLELLIIYIFTVFK